MKTLSEAWDWYHSTRRSLQRMRILGTKYWDGLPWESNPIGGEDEFKFVEAEEIEGDTRRSLGPIDDLAIVVLFSVFESMVRGFVVESIRPEAEMILHPVLRHAADAAIRGIEEGSFYLQVLAPLQRGNRVSAELVTQVNQVRDYRNWVAHGRRESPRNNVSPEVAYQRLSRFLDAIGVAVEPETP